VSEALALLDDGDAIAARDPHGTARAIAGFPAQCRTAVTIRVHRAPAIKRPRVVVIAAMGGSAAAGDLVAACAAERVEVPIVVHRGYGLPSVAWDDALVLAVSYSGDTAEVLSAVETTRARRLPLVVVTAGGRLSRLAADRTVAAALVPPALQPRLALGYLFFPMVRALRQVDVEITSPEDVEEALAVLEALGRELTPDRPAADNEAKRIALAIGERWPAVYGGPMTGGIAYRWKTDVEENAKRFALAGVLPEMNHNTIEAWRAPGARDVHLILLRDGGEEGEIRRRFALLAELASGVAGGVTECWPRGRGVLARLLSLTYLGQWTSYYLAVLRGVDPWTVPQLEALKRRLRQR
jgi:glucose/mannose-6-phosphate isomerase